MWNEFNDLVERKGEGVGVDVGSQIERGKRESNEDRGPDSTHLLCNLIVKEYNSPGKNSCLLFCLSKGKTPVMIEYVSIYRCWVCV